MRGIGATCRRLGPASVLAGKGDFFPLLSVPCRAFWSLNSPSPFLPRYSHAPFLSFTVSQDSGRNSMQQTWPMFCSASDLVDPGSTWSIEFNGRQQCHVIRMNVLNREKCWEARLCDAIICRWFLWTANCIVYQTVFSIINRQILGGRECERL